ncbi:hypothetical protein ACFSHT_28870 [Paraburkholderia silviterrae]|uniref:Uncharacterized protein n=1 Tax=Paraburkholderia silviterrae TaxID=2528715 RepID=A0A4R5M5L2_9BURK|nr:hypothetical protein [Paraburkholderia silviterrae]TDG21159.1 hypothetical protein EYW47_22580 [Paraburkholderia silviterrae]
MLSETELREQYAILQQRGLQLEGHGASRIDQLAAAVQLPPNGHADEYMRVMKEAIGEATFAIQRYQNALLFLETADSLIEALAKPPAFDDGMEWHDELLYRLAEVLETATDLIAEGEAHLERSLGIGV